MIDGLLDAALIAEPGSLRIVSVNAAAAALFGVDAAALCQQDLFELAATPEDIGFWEAHANHLDESVEARTMISRADGRLRPVLRRVSRIGTGGRQGVYLVVMRDRSQELLAQSELEERVSELRATLESTHDGILVLDLSGRIVNANERFGTLWQVPEALLTQRDSAAVAAWMLRRVVDPVSYTRRLTALSESASAPGRDVLTLRDGRLIERQTTPQRSRGQTIGHVHAFRDLTERPVPVDSRTGTAHGDALTGLPLRFSLLGRIEFAMALARRERVDFALLHLDVDRFGPVNDLLGSAFGDQLLIQVADRLGRTLREVDALVRLEADAFGMLIYQADSQRAQGAAQRLIEALQSPFDIEGVQIGLSASIGIALFPGDGDTPEALLEAAVSAMTDMKQAGGAGYRFRRGAGVLPVAPTDSAASSGIAMTLGTRPRDAASLDHAMRQALVSGRFRLHYQPQVDLASGEVVGAEALIRWRDPELGDVPPDEFIPVAERSGFIVDIGAWVLHQAVQQAAAWRERGHNLLMSVNVSALQFQQPDFVDSVARALAEFDLEPHRLELELTESILIQDAQEALHRLEALAALGVKLAIDDFGTGYSSLAYLKRFPIGRLKIDRSFVQGLPGDESDAGIVRALVQLGRALRVDVVADGVKTQEQRQFMRESGCGQYQGELFAPALDAVAFDALLDRSRQTADDLDDIKGWLEGET
jgi:diguanylate cyclase (GGDEF)-like protein/PAS domain S-box-containing protein